MSRVVFFIFLSLLLHFANYWFAGLIVILIPEIQKNEKIEVDLVSSDSIPLVRQSEITEDLKSAVDDLKTKATAFSQKTVRVHKQVQARQLGLAENVLPQYKFNNSPTVKDQNRNLKNDGDLLVKKEKSIEDLMATAGIPRPKDYSKSSTHFDNVDYGNFTALNTDRHLFYSYYSRIEEGIRWIWEREIRRSHPNDASLNSANSTWKTRVDILLNEDGSFDRAIYLKLSGIPDFDLAVQTAFKTAKIFPNPPSEMIGPDKKIRLKYLFEVYYKPKLLAHP